jgi:hypothetical protein
LERFSEEIGPTIDAMIEALDQEGEDPLEKIRNQLMLKMRELVPLGKIQGAFPLLRDRVLVSEGRGKRFIELGMERVPLPRASRNEPNTINQLFFHVGELVGRFRADPFVKEYAEAEITGIDSAASLLEKCERLHAFLDKIRLCEFAYANFSDKTFITEAGTALRDCFDRIKADEREGALGEKLDTLEEALNRLLTEEKR